VSARGPYREWEETFEAFGAVYRFAFRGPVEEPARWEVAILDADGVAVVPRRVRGRTEDEARWRAEETVQTWVSVRRLHAAAARAAARVAPGSEVVVHERAGEVEVDLTGPWGLRAPFLATREDVVPPPGRASVWEQISAAHPNPPAVRWGRPPGAGPEGPALPVPQTTSPERAVVLRLGRVRGDAPLRGTVGGFRKPSLRSRGAPVETSREDGQLGARLVLHRGTCFFSKYRR
jgi:hypothetical protein